MRQPRWDTVISLGAYLHKCIMILLFYNFPVLGLLHSEKLNL